MKFPETLHEPIPPWLANHMVGQKIAMPVFFGSRVVYYPGSGHDGHPVQFFGSAHIAHCFVYVDYGVSQLELERDLNSLQDGFRGYRSLDRILLTQADLTPRGWTSHITQQERVRINQQIFSRGFVDPFGFLEILERNMHLDDAHGPHRLAILFLGADGIASYDALFCQGTYQAPFALVIQEHGVGGNYDAFGRGSKLEQIASRAGIFPEWLLVAENSESWDGYEAVSNMKATQGGEHGMKRILFKRQPT